MASHKIKSHESFEAEHDAVTLSRAAEIKQDKKRLGAAKKVASRMAEEKIKAGRALKKIARKAPARKRAR